MASTGILSNYYHYICIMINLAKIILILSLNATIVQAQNITISEINYHSADKPNPKDWFELHNTTATAINIGGYTLSDTNAGTTPYLIPANTILPANGYLVFVSDQISFSSIHPGVTNFYGNLTFSLNNNADIIRLKDATGNLIVEAGYLDKNPWPQGADGEGRTLELINQNSTTNLMDVSSWRDGCMGGSPGTAPVLCNDPIVFTEINYNSDSLLNMGEFVELYNNSTNAIDLTGWYLQDGVDSATNKFYFYQNTILNPGAYLLVSNDTAALRKFHGKLPNQIGDFSFNFSNGGEVIKLVNPFDILKFSVHYNDSIPFTDSADGDGYTLELKSKTGNMNDGTNWFAGCKGGSPGVAYTPNCRLIAPLNISSNKELSNFEYYITPDKIKINNKLNVPFIVRIYTMEGKLIYNQNYNQQNASIATNHLAGAGIYIMQCITKDAQSSFKLYLQP